MTARLDPNDPRPALLSAIGGIEVTLQALAAATEAVAGRDALDRAARISAQARTLRLALLPAAALIDDIIGVVAAEMDLAPAMIRGAGRQRRTVAARWAVIRIARSEGLASAEIASAMGLDHTTVAHALSRMAAIPGAGGADLQQGGSDVRV